MASKELIDRCIIAADNSGYELDPTAAIEVIIHAVASTILAALQEPTEDMQLVVSANWGRRTWAEYQQVLNASPLGEQSE